MKIGRYIKFPLIFGLLMLLNYLFHSIFDWTLNGVLFSLVCSVVIGIGLQMYSDHKIRKIKPDAAAIDFDVNQAKQAVILCDYQRAFDLCLESIGHLKKGRITLENFEDGIIQAKTGVTLNSFGTAIEIRLKKLTEYSTEIEITARPSINATLIDYGESIEKAITIHDFLTTKNEELLYNRLDANREIPIDFYASTSVPIQNRKANSWIHAKSSQNRFKFHSCGNF